MAKIFKLAGISGIIILIVTILTVILTFGMAFSAIGGSSLDEAYTSALKILLISAIIVAPLNVVFLYGFVDLAKRFNNRLLLTISWIFIILAIFSLIIGLISIFNLDKFELPNNQEKTITGSIKESAYSSPVMEAIFSFFGDSMFWFLFVVLVLGSILLRILFGVGLIKLNKNKVPLSKLAGIFEIISVVINLKFVAIILEVIMFFKVSKEFNGKEKSSKA